MAQAVIDPHADALKAATLPAGTVLAARYRLEELIAESRPTVTWRAFDQVLSRSVLVHLLSPGRRRGRGRPAGRGPAGLGGHRLALPPGAGRGAQHRSRARLLHRLRVRHRPVAGADAEPGAAVRAGGGLGGPRGRRRAGRRAQPGAVPPADQPRHGDHHPERQRQDRRAADRGRAAAGRRAPVVHGADTPELVDVTDLGRLLYACLVSRWPGGPAYSLPDAPVLGRRWATPRQVRAGVSPALDTSATRSSATRRGTGPARSPPRTTWSSR